MRWDPEVDSAKEKQSQPVWKNPTKREIATKLWGTLLWAQLTQCYLDEETTQGNGGGQSLGCSSCGIPEAQKMFHAILVVTVTDAGCEVADEAALCRAHRDAGTAASLRGEIHWKILYSWSLSSNPWNIKGEQLFFWEYSRHLGFQHLHDSLEDFTVRGVSSVEFGKGEGFCVSVRRDMMQMTFDRKETNALGNPLSFRSASHYIQLQIPSFFKRKFFVTFSSAIWMKRKQMVCLQKAAVNLEDIDIKVRN